MENKNCECGKPEDPTIKGGFRMCRECWDFEIKMFQEYKRNRKKLEPSIDLIMERLYLGNEDAATTRTILDERKITHVLVAGSHLDMPFVPDITYKQLDLQDFPDQDIKQYFEEAAKFIYSALKEGKSVLVHCAAGISRSATIVVAYLMLINNLGFEEAFELLKSKRSIVYPNSGFKSQLQAFGEELKSGLLKIAFE